MHELSIAMNIVEIAEENARKEGAKVVTEIELEIGTLSGVVLEALEFAMDSAIKGTMLENAKVVIMTVNGRAKCAECGNVFETDTPFEPCPGCGNPFSDIIQGKELTVKKLKVE
jgi:hydrogenase nickel incorporation protein HypA/HybF